MVGMLLGALIASGGIVVLAAGLGTAFAQTTTSSTTTNAFPMMTNAPSYTGNATIVVSGAYSAASFVSITINNPRGHSITSQNPAVNAQGNFSASFQASWLLGWNTTGTYTAVGSYTPPDYTGQPITASVTFLYTAVPPATTTTTASTSSSSTPATSVSTSSGPGISAIDLVPLVIVVVIIIGVLGFLLRSRGRRGARSRAPAQPAGK